MQEEEEKAVSQEDAKTSLLDGALSTSRSSLPWSLHKREIVMKRNPKKKSALEIGGLELISEEEEKKRLARLERWNPTAVEEIEEKAKEAERKLKRAERFGSAVDGATVEWTKFDFEVLKKYHLEPAHLYEKISEEIPVPEACDRLHLRVLPQYASTFKFLKTWDIEARFQRAQYVEWLGDASCNIWFSEKAEAERALLSETVQVQPPPQGLALDPLPNYYRLLSPPLSKSKNDAWGKMGTHPTFLLCRFATESDVLKSKPKHARLPSKGKRRRDFSAKSQSKYLPIPMDTDTNQQQVVPPPSDDNNNLSNTLDATPPEQAAEQAEDADDEDNMRASKRRKFVASKEEAETPQEQALPGPDLTAPDPSAAVPLTEEAGMS